MKNNYFKRILENKEKIMSKDFAEVPVKSVASLWGVAAYYYGLKMSRSPLSNEEESILRRILKKNPKKIRPEDIRRLFIEDLALLYRSGSLEPVEDYLRWLEEALGEAGYEARMLTGNLGYRLVYGTSGFGLRPLVEIGLEIDPIFNVPVVRGSALKGAFRAYVEQLGRGGEDCGLVYGALDVLFGVQGEGESRVGALFFSDMYPVRRGMGGLLLMPDVLTPHYKDDTVDEVEAEPKPIPFFSLQLGVRVGFVLGVNRRLVEGVEGLPSLDDVVRCLAAAFKVFGVGAKTSVGYGVVNLEV